MHGAATFWKPLGSGACMLLRHANSLQRCGVPPCMLVAWCELAAPFDCVAPVLARHAHTSCTPCPAFFKTRYRLSCGLMPFVRNDASNRLARSVHNLLRAQRFASFVSRLPLVAAYSKRCRWRHPRTTGGPTSSGNATQRRCCSAAATSCFRSSRSSSEQVTIPQCCRRSRCAALSAVATSKAAYQNVSHQRCSIRARVVVPAFMS